MLDVPVVPTLMGWGTIPDDHRLMAGMAGLQTAHRYGNATMLASDFVLGIGNRWANRHTGGLDVYRDGRTFVHVDIEPTQIGRVFAPDYGDRLRRRRGAASCSSRSREERTAAGRLRDRSVGRRVPRAQAHDAAPHPLRRRPGQAAAGLRGDEPRLRPGHPLRHHDRALADRRRRSSCTSTSRGTGSTPARPARWAGRCPPRSGSAPPTRTRPWSRCRGDYDFQFMIEELAVGAQFNLPYIHVLVNNSYLGLIRQSQRGFDMDYCVQLGFDNINSPGAGQATASTTSRSPRAWAARRCGSTEPERPRGRRSSRPRS